MTWPSFVRWWWFQVCVAFDHVNVGTVSPVSPVSTVYRQHALVPPTFCLLRIQGSLPFTDYLGRPVRYQTYFERAYQTIDVLCRSIVLSEVKLVMAPPQVILWALFAGSLTHFSWKEGGGVSLCIYCILVCVWLCLFVWRHRNNNITSNNNNIKPFVCIVIISPYTST